MASGGSEPPCDAHPPSPAKKPRIEDESPQPVQQPPQGPTWLPSAPSCEADRGGSSCGASIDSGLSDGATSPLERSTTPLASSTALQPDTEMTSRDGTRGEEEGGNEGPEGEEDDLDDLSSLGGLSDMSGHDWKPNMTGKLAWLHRAMSRGEDPRLILLDLLPGGSSIPEEMDTMTLWKVLFNLLSEPPRREKLSHVNTLEDCVSLIKSASNIIVLTGAGVSVSCGIPDFRSKDGVYARLAVDFPDLPDPQAMFDIHYFRKDPRPFFKFAREIYPGQFQPSPCHRFIRCLEEHQSLLRNYTQNIDTLEQVAGIKNVIQCHGSFATASCMVCRLKVDAEVIRNDIFDQNIPLCENCPKPDLQDIFKEKDAVKPVDTKVKEDESDNADAEVPGSSKSDVNEELADSAEGSSSDPTSDPSTSSDVRTFSSPERSPFTNVPVMKPDIVFFGEGLSDDFHHAITRDKSSCDLLIVIGSSLKVRPVALIPSSLPPEVPQILINREPLPHCTFDVELLGDCDAVVNQICRMLGDGWNSPVHAPILSQHTGVPKDILPSEKEPKILESQHCLGESSLTTTTDILTTNESESSSSCNLSKEVPTESKELTEQQASTKDDSKDDLEEDWKPRPSLADHIPSGHYIFLPPARYVFSGAEVLMDSSDEEDLESLPDDEDNEGAENPTGKSTVSTEIVEPPSN